MSKKEKKSKNGRRRDASSESSSESSGSSSEDNSSSSESSSDSETDRIQVKRPRLNSASKKKKRKERKKLEKKKKRKAANKITKEDFYSKSIEFRLWLMEERKLPMDSMKTTKAKTLFKKFVRRWNEGKLAKKYYKGIDAADVKGSLTKYRWKFAGKVENQPSSTSNSPLVAGVKPPPATFSTFGKSSSPKAPARNMTVGPEKPVLGPQRPPHLAEQDSDEDQKRERSRVRAERKKYREDDKLTMEELAPRATGHQAKVEKKLMRRQRAHSPEVSDRVLMGSGMDYEPMMARKRKSDALRKERNTEKASTKLREYQEKESAKMKALLEIARANKSKDALW